MSRARRAAIVRGSMTETSAPPQLLAQDLEDLIALVRNADRVELKMAPKGVSRKPAVELWFYPDGSRILELSTKCAPSEAFQVAVETRAFLMERGVRPSAGQQTKTRKALEFFSRHPG